LKNITKLPETGGITKIKKEATMPGGDKTGPQGEGPQTGRQAGYCSGSEDAGYDQPGYGRPGFGRMSFGFRRPRRYGRWPVHMHGQDVEERNSLLQEVRELKDLVSGLQKKVDELEK
jgi:hypothetical protein